jgi:hypothetical protein
LKGRRRAKDEGRRELRIRNKEVRSLKGRRRMKDEMSSE